MSTEQENKRTRRDWHHTCANCGKDKRLIGERYCRECYEEMENDDR